MNVILKGERLVSHTTKQKDKTLVIFLYSHYLTFSEGPRETFGPVACVNYNQEIHKVL